MKVLRRLVECSVAGLALALPWTEVGAQTQEPPRRIGLLGMNSKMQVFRFAAFRDEMRKLGYVEGGNLIIEVRWSRNLAVALAVALAIPILAITGLLTALAAHPPVGAASIALSAPTTLAYQGQVKVNGQPFTGLGQFKFAIINAGGRVFAGMPAMSRSQASRSTPKARSPASDSSALASGATPASNIAE